MKKIISLIKASMTDGMNIFKINTKKSSAATKVVIPAFLALTIIILMYSYAKTFMEQLAPINMQFVVLTIFIIITSIMTIVEGIYKSGNLLFNCKDDNLLLSLPIKKSTVLFIRIFKFYLFELLYNSLFLLSPILLYGIEMHADISYFITSCIGLLLFPIVPILISCIVGTIVTFISSKFKGKNIAQTIITVAFLLVVLFISFRLDSLITKIAQNASSINDFITKLYYPAGAYIELVTNFNVLKLIEFVIIHLVLFVTSILIIGKVYFNINSSIKSVKKEKTSKEYKIKTNSQVKSLIKKEFNRFINSPVFITNAGFGLVLHAVGCILIAIKFSSIGSILTESGIEVTTEQIRSYLPVVLFAFICFSSFMTSITSSMISLEGKSFNILKSLPVKPFTIIKSKILTAVIMMIPCIILGDIIIFVRFSFDIVSILILLAASIVLPLISETIGIIVNLKYPRMDAKNDTEVVKQSMSSSISVFIGMGIIGVTISLLVKALNASLSNNVIILLFTLGFTIIYAGLIFLLHKICNKLFDNISA